MMNKLWVRLALAFGVVTIVGLVTVAILSRAQISTQFMRFVVANQLSNPVLHNALTTHFAEHGSWDGIEKTFAQFDRRNRDPNRDNQRNPRARPLASNLLLTDANGRVVYNQQGSGPKQISSQVLQEAVPVENNDQTIGYLIVQVPARNELSIAAQSFLTRVNSLLFQAGLVAGAVGILLGLTIARGLTAPLRTLATAARRLSHGNLGEKVPVSGAKEVADLARAFNEMSQGLAEAEQLRRNLMADVAHELRTPLSVLQGNLRAILDDVYQMDKTEVARLYDQTRLLHRLVDDLHELAQAEAKQLSLNLTPINLGALISETAETFSPMAEISGVQVQTDLGDKRMTIEGDSTRLKQVFHNLLTNSLRHTPEGGTISLTLKENQGQVALVIADTGDGISAEHLPHIFDRFYRADPARSRDRGGAGLGLPIAKAIITAHQGQITVESAGQPGLGSQFTITLPAYSST